MISSVAFSSFLRDLWETALPLLVAGLCGGVVGLERERANRPAGLRTHVLVCVGSALIMQVSLTMPQWGNADPGRIAAQVVSGIGFLGAGTIMREGVNIRGLTTAASLWVVAGVGLAVGAGLYAPAIVTVVVTVITLRCMSVMERQFLSKGGERTLVLQVKDTPGQLAALAGVCARQGVSITGVDIRPGSVPGTVEISLRFRAPGRMNTAPLIGDFMATEGVLSVTEEE